MIINRCLEKSNILSNRLPLECLTAKHIESSYKIDCCGTDFCNANVEMEFPTRGIIYISNKQKKNTPNTYHNNFL